MKFSAFYYFIDTIKNKLKKEINNFGQELLAIAQRFSSFS
jgi:hypothetical protein